MYRWTQQFLLDDHWLIKTLVIDFDSLSFFSGYKDLKVQNVWPQKTFHILIALQFHLLSILLKKQKINFLDNDMPCIMCSYTV